MNNYLKFRGNCKEMAQQLADKEGYTLVRGYYYEPFWDRKEQHWWCIDKEGNIHDPSKKQFPSNGIKEFYTEFDGTVECEQCGKVIKEEEVVMQGRFPTCSYRCAGKLVGLL